MGDDSEGNGSPGIHYHKHVEFRGELDEAADEEEDEDRAEHPDHLECASFLLLDSFPTIIFSLHWKLVDSSRSWLFNCCLERY